MTPNDAYGEIMAQEGLLMRGLLQSVDLYWAASLLL